MENRQKTQKKKERIGILGGSFNPIHSYHIQLAQQAFKEYGLDKVLFIPTKQPPHKKLSAVADDKRQEMVELAIAGHKNFEISLVEMEREGVTYSVDTLTWLKEHFKNSEWFFIIGEDTLYQLHTWKNAEEVYAMCTFLVAPREVETYSLKGKKVSNKVSYQYLTMERKEISSTNIKKEIETGKSPLVLPMPYQVRGYIALLGLYGAKPLLINGEGIFEKLRRLIGVWRLAHSLSVMVTCIKLAACHGEDMLKATLAGLLHDCGKELSLEEMQNILMEKKENFSEQMWNSSALLHSYAGAQLCKKLFMVEDEEVLIAIENHTTGAVPMKRLEMIVFLADGIEPMRQSTAKLEKIRKMAKENLEKAFLMSVCYSIETMRQSGKTIEPTIYQVKKWMER